MTPTRYELLIENGKIYLRGFSPATEKGYFNVEAVPFKSGACLPALRLQGAKQAKSMKVPFIDKTVATQ